jgi:hypothetical protein
MPLRKPPTGEGRPVDHEPKREPKELPPAVKVYVDNTGARIKKIFAELGAKNPEQLAEMIKAGELNENQIDQAEIVQELMLFRAYAKEHGEISQDERTDHELVDMARRDVARSVDEIDEFTLAWVGPLEPGIFQKLPESVEHIYSSFPDGKIYREHMEIGGQTAAELTSAIQKAGIKTSRASEFLLSSNDFITLKTSEEMIAIRLTARDLGFAAGAETGRIYARAEELGLDLCPAETGPHYRLANPDQPMNDSVVVAMKQILTPEFNPCVFYVDHKPDGLYLNAFYADPGGWKNAGDHFLFRLPNKSAKS